MKKAPKKAVPKKAVAKKVVKKTKKIVYESESEDEAPVHKKSSTKQKIITHPSCVFI